MQHLSLKELIKNLVSIRNRDKIALEKNLLFYNMRKMDISQDQQKLMREFNKLNQDNERLVNLSELIFRIDNYKYIEIMNQIENLTKQDAKIQNRIRENWTAQISLLNNKIDVRMSFNP